MINEERLELAIAAMESGEHLKGTGFLHQIDEEGVSRKCCLGILTLVAVANGLEISRRIAPGGYRRPAREVFADHDDPDDDEVLCAEVMDWYGLPDSDPTLITPSGDYRNASLWNDNGPLPDRQGSPEEDFTEIAAGFRRTFLEER